MTLGDVLGFMTGVTILCVSLWSLRQNVTGGKVFAQWPGLKDEPLEPPGDLRVITDYRDVLSEIVARRLQNAAVNEVFSGHISRAVLSFERIK